MPPGIPTTENSMATRIAPVPAVAPFVATYGHPKKPRVSFGDSSPTGANSAPTMLSINAFLVMTQNSYKGPGGIVLTRDEAEKLLELLTLNPRSWNAELRGKLIAYLEFDCQA